MHQLLMHAHPQLEVFRPCFNMKLFSIPGKLHCPTAAVETQQAEQEGGRGGAEGGAEGGGAVPVHSLARPRYSSQHPRSPQLHQEVLRCHSGITNNQTEFECTYLYIQICVRVRIYDYMYSEQFTKLFTLSYNCQTQVSI